MYAATINGKLGHTFQKDLGGLNGRTYREQRENDVELIIFSKNKSKNEKIKNSHLSLGIPIFMT